MDDQYVITIKRPKGVSHSAMKRYIEDAISGWLGGNPESPLNDPDTDTLTVKRLMPSARTLTPEVRERWQQLYAPKAKPPEQGQVEAIDRPVHETRPIQVWADVDVGIADMVVYLNTIPGVRTHASCQGTIGEGGPAPYRAQVLTIWPPEVFERLQTEFDITLHGDNWGYLHPKKKGI